MDTVHTDELSMFQQEMVTWGARRAGVQYSGCWWLYVGGTLSVHTRGKIRTWELEQTGAGTGTAPSHCITPNKQTGAGTGTAPSHHITHNTQTGEGTATAPSLCITHNKQNWSRYRNSSKSLHHNKQTHWSRYLNSSESLHHTQQTNWIRYLNSSESLHHNKQPPTCLIVAKLTEIFPVISLFINFRLSVYILISNPSVPAVSE